jgi:hypothetical protein
MDNDELKRCEEEVDRLKVENEHLRDSANTFGHLAERLNGELRAERRAGVDRRQTARESAERRAL